MRTFTELSRIEEEAAAWLFETDRGLSDREAARFEAWLTTSEDHARAWTRAMEIWTSVDLSDPLVEAMRRDALLARPRIFRPALAAKASILTAALMVAGIAGWQTIREPKAEYAPVTIARDVAPTLASGSDAGRSTTLPDGTRVQLEEDTAIALAFTPSRRDLRLLKGQAYFDVLHDKDRPFAVQAADAVVTATGTRFMVRALSSGMVTTLDRGTIIVSRHRNEAKVTLLPGQQVTAMAGSPLTLSSAKSPEAAARQSGYLEFNNTPLEEAVLQVNRFGDGSHIVLSSNTQGLSISGRFHLGDVDGFVNAVVQILPLRRSRGANGAIKLSKR